MTPVDSNTRIVGCCKPVFEVQVRSVEISIVSENFTRILVEVTTAESPEDGDEDSMKATGSALVGNPADQPPGTPKPPRDSKLPDDATEHPTVLDNGTRPFEVVYDPDYWSDQASGGQDYIRYRVPLDEIDGWRRIRAQLYYQTIPPYYLRDRFQTGMSEEKRFPLDRDMNRLVHMASRLNLEGTPAQDWSLRVGPPAVKNRGAAADPRLTAAQKKQRLQQHFDYLNLTDAATHR